MEQLKRDDKKLSMALVSTFVILTFQYFILITLDLIETPSAARVQLISKLLVAMVFVYAFPVIWKRSKIKLLGTYYLWSFIFLLHYLIFPGNRMYMHELIFPLFFMCLPALIYSWSIYNWGVLKKMMERASIFVFWMGIVLTVLILSGRASIGAYSMSLSYYMLLPALMFTNDSFNSFSLKSLVYALLSIIIILALGSRGAMMCLVVFVFLKLFRPGRKLGYKELFSYLVLIAAGLFVLVFIEDILEYLNNFLLQFGVRSRTILLFLRPGIYMSGRDRLYEIVWKEVLTHPILGLGLAGDRPLIGGYVHNFFIEIIAHFGFLLGSLLLVLFIVLMLRALMAKDLKRYEMLIVWMCLGFVPLQVSSSYLINMNFWILLGLILRGRMLVKVKK